MFCMVHRALHVFSSLPPPPPPPQDLQEHKLTLKGVLETHFHADFVSGHCELSQRTEATIYFGPGSAARTQFDIHELQDNEACVLVFISLCSGPKIYVSHNLQCAVTRYHICNGF